MSVDRDQAQRRLEEERQRLQASLAGVGSDLGEEESGTAELSTVDQHPADQGTETHDLERDLGLRNDLEARLLEVDEACRRLDQGRYGVCERCGRMISPERLEAFPSTRYCVDDERVVEHSARS